MRATPRRRAILVSGLVPVLIVGLVACGADEPSRTSGEATSASAAATPSETALETPAETASETPAEAASEVDEAAGSGSWDERTLFPAMTEAIASHKSAHVTLVTTSGGMELSSEGDLAFRGKTQDLVLVMEGQALGTERIEVRMVDNVVYVSMPPMTPKGKFFEIPGDDSSSAFGQMLGQMQGVDPRKSFDVLESGLRDLELVGKEQVGGQDLEHYRLTVDPRVVAKAQGLPRTADMPRRVTYDLWVDENALMRRMELEMAQVGMVMEMTDWDEPVSIKAPAPRDLVAPPGH